MQRHPQNKTSPGVPPIAGAAVFAAKTAVFYAAMCIVLGIQTPILPVWLTAKGLNAHDIGFLLAIPLVARIVTIPLVNREADRRDALRGTLHVCVILSFLGTLALGFADARPGIVLFFMLSSIAFTPAFPLLDAYALKGLADRGRPYGPVRMWGSVAYIAGTLAAGWLMDAMNRGALIWVIVASLGLASLCGFLLAPLAPHQDTERRRSILSLWRIPGVAVVIAASAFIQAGHAFYYGFSVLAWQAEGYDSVVIGLLWATGIIMEIVLFAVSGRLPRRIGPTVLLILGGVGAVLRWSAMACDPPALLLPLLQGLHALSFGATYLGVVGFVVRVVPVGLTASAQGAIAVANGLVMAAATALSGFLYTAQGSRAYAVMALFALAGLICAIMAHRHREAGPAAA